MKKVCKMISIVIGIFLLLLISAAGCLYSYAHPRVGPEIDISGFEGKPGFRNGVFHNQEPDTDHFEKLKKKKFSFFRFLFRNYNAPENPLPMKKLTKADFKDIPDSDSVIWLGHSSMIFELGGKRFATDLVFGNASPIPWTVRRYGPPPLPRSELPRLDFVLISHDHYDHLEYETVRAMRDKSHYFVCPLGVGQILRYWGIGQDRIHELGWGDSVSLSGIKISARPARHFSGRSFGGRNKTLWASYIFEGYGKKIFFGADNAYGKHFKEIGEADGPFDLALLEMDAWNERWPHTHMFPFQIPLAVRDLKAKNYQPIHYNVFDLAMHPWNESIDLLKPVLEKEKIPHRIPIQGERVPIP